MLRILLVDHDQPLLALYAQLLSGHDCEVVQVTTGGAALRKAASREIDGAVIELGLPDISGLKVLEALSLGGVRCIVATSNGNCRTAVTAMRLGALDFLEKPIDPEDFLRAVGYLTSASSGLASSTFAGAASCVHSITRWAAPIVRMLDASEDPRTLDEYTAMIRYWYAFARRTRSAEQWQVVMGQQTGVPDLPERKDGSRGR